MVNDAALKTQANQFRGVACDFFYEENCWMFKSIWEIAEG